MNCVGILSGIHNKNNFHLECIILCGISFLFYERTSIKNVILAICVAKRWTMQQFYWFNHFFVCGNINAGLIHEKCIIFCVHKIQYFVENCLLPLWWQWQPHKILFCFISGSEKHNFCLFNVHVGFSCKKCFCCWMRTNLSMKS